MEPTSLLFLQRTWVRYFVRKAKVGSFLLSAFIFFFLEVATMDKKKKMDNNGRIISDCGQQYAQSIHPFSYTKSFRGFLEYLSISHHTLLLFHKKKSVVFKCSYTNTYSRLHVCSV